jgi:hypothetical protein
VSNGELREQRDRWQQQAERLAALAIMDQWKEPAPDSISHGGLFLWLVGLICGGVLIVALHGAPLEW